MQLRKTRWSKVYESSEEELVAFLAERNIFATRWTLDAFGDTEPHKLASDMTIWCAEGAASFQVDRSKISIQPGDALDIPANMELAITAGMFGCVCYQTSQ